jgi:hypothetical protein
LDEYISVWKVQKLNDPLIPISDLPKLLKQKREINPIYWLHRNQRFGRKLAPDVTVADLLGILIHKKAANLKLLCG